MLGAFSYPVCSIHCLALARGLAAADQETKHLRALQPAVLAFFKWLNTRLSSVRVLNVECRVTSSSWRCHWAWPRSFDVPRPQQRTLPSTAGAARLRAIRLVVAQPDPLYLSAVLA